MGVAYLTKNTFRQFAILMTLISLTAAFTLQAQAQAIKEETPESVAAQLSKLPAKDKLVVFINTVVGSNYILLDVAKNNSTKYGSIDEQQELRLALAKAKFMQAVQQKVFPDKFGTYFPDWIKTLNGYLTGTVSFMEFVEERKKLHPQLQDIMKSDFKQEEAKKIGNKHAALIKKLSQSFYIPSFREVKKMQLTDVKNHANYTNTLCLPVKDKWKKCGLTGDVKQSVSKLKNSVADGNAKIYKTMRIGNKFVVYVVYQQTKKQMEEALKDILAKQPTAVSATFSLNAATSLCNDNNFKTVLENTKSTGQVIVHSRNLIPIANLRFKNCADLKKLTTAKKQPSAKK